MTNRLLYMTMTMTMRIELVIFRKSKQFNNSAVQNSLRLVMVPPCDSYTDGYESSLEILLWEEICLALIIKVDRISI